MEELRTMLRMCLYNIDKFIIEYRNKHPNLITDEKDYRIPKRDARGRFIKGSMEIHYSPEYRLRQKAQMIVDEEKSILTRLYLKNILADNVFKEIHNTLKWENFPLSWLVYAQEKYLKLRHDIMVMQDFPEPDANIKAIISNVIKAQDESESMDDIEKTADLVKQVLDEMIHSGGVAEEVIRFVFNETIQSKTEKYLKYINNKKMKEK